MTRFEKRRETADLYADQILAEYGDVESAKDRVLALVNGQGWLERLVLRQMTRRTSPPKKFAQKQIRQRKEELTLTQRDSHLHHWRRPQVVRQAA